MFAWPGTPATAVTRPPPTAGPRLRNLMFSRMSWLFSSAAFCFSSAGAAMHKIRVVSSASPLTVLDVIGLLLKKVQYFIPNSMKPTLVGLWTGHLNRRVEGLYHLDSRRIQVIQNALSVVGSRSTPRRQDAEDFLLVRSPVRQG